MPENCQTDDKNQNEYQDSGKDIRCREEGGELLQEHVEHLHPAIQKRLIHCQLISDLFKMF